MRSFVYPSGRLLTLAAVLVCLTSAPCLLHADPGQHPLIQTIGSKADTHQVYVYWPKADTIRLRVDAQALQTSRQSPGKRGWRISLPKLSDGLHHLYITFLQNGSVLRKRRLDFSTKGRRVLFKRTYLWLSRFDLVAGITRANVSSQSVYNNLVKKNIRSYLHKAKVAGISDILFQVRGQGDVLYRSRLEPFSHLLNPDAKLGLDPGWDPLQYAVDCCRALDLRLHCWFNTLPVYRSGALSYKQNVYGKPLPVDRLRQCLAVNREGVLKQKNGYLFLHPAHPQTRTYIKQLLAEIIDHYPCHGIHFDYIRMVDREHLYNPHVEADFRMVKGSQSYDAYLTRKLNVLVHSLYLFAKQRNPELVLSAATLPSLNGSGYSARRFYQSPATWINQRYLDLVFPMTYEPRRLPGYLQEYLDEIASSRRNCIVPGIGLYLTLPEEGNMPVSPFLRAMDTVAGNDALGGMAIFSGQAFVQHFNAIYKKLNE